MKVLMCFIMSRIFAWSRGYQFVCTLAERIWDRWCCVNTWTSFAVQHLHQACQWEQTSTRWHKSEMSPFCKPATFFSFGLSVPLELPSISSWILYKQRESFCSAGIQDGRFFWKAHHMTSTWQKKHTAAPTHNGHTVYWLCWGWWELTVLAASTVVPETQRWHPSGFELANTKRGALAKAWLGVEDWTC